MDDLGIPFSRAARIVGRRSGVAELLKPCINLHDWHKLSPWKRYIVHYAVYPYLWDGKLKGYVHIWDFENEERSSLELAPAIRVFFSTSNQIIKSGEGRIFQEGIIA